jgi:hypothetical protein
MGLLWSFFNPILMLVVYTFVFGVVFRARWGLGDDASTAKFAVVLFSGLITYNLFSECVNGSFSARDHALDSDGRNAIPCRYQCRRSYRVQRGCTRRRSMDCGFTAPGMASVCTADDGDMLDSCLDGRIYARCGARS